MRVIRNSKRLIEIDFVVNEIIVLIISLIIIDEIMNIITLVRDLQIMHKRF